MTLLKTEDEFEIYKRRWKDWRHVGEPVRYPCIVASFKIVNKDEHDYHIEHDFAYREILDGLA